jgi:hypothetical protein
MMMRKLIPLLVASMPLAGHAAPIHKLRTIEQAVEMMAFEVRLDSTSRAVLSAKPCDQCAPVTLRIDADTRLTRAGKALALDALNDAVVQPATVFYLPETGRVTRINFWR